MLATPISYHKENYALDNMRERFVLEHERLKNEGSVFATAIQAGAEIKDEMQDFVKDLAGHIGLMIQLRRSEFATNSFGFALKELIEKRFGFANKVERFGLDQAFVALNQKIFGGDGVIKWGKGLEAIRTKAQELINPETIKAYIDKIFTPAADDAGHAGYQRLFKSPDRPGQDPENKVLAEFPAMLTKPVEADALAEEVRSMITTLSATPSHLAGVSKSNAAPMVVTA